MWWNFAGRSHDEIVAARDAWEAESSAAAEPARFGIVGGHDIRIPAPPLPDVRLMPRGRPDLILMTTSDLFPGTLARCRAPQHPPR